MKYIVYKTTNLVNNYIYIGVHATNDNISFDGYIGNGVRITDVKSYEKGTTKFKQAVKEYGVNNFHRETIAIFDTAEEAYELEKQLVNENFLKRSDVYNMLLGGIINHTHGIKVFIYDASGKFVNECTSREIAAKQLNCDAKTIEYAINHKCIIKGTHYVNTDKVEQLDLTQYTTGIKNTPIYRYKLTGEFDKEFSSYHEAARDINTNAAKIYKSCKLAMAYNGFYFLTVKDVAYDKAKLKYLKERTIYQYDSNGKYITTFEHQKDAEKMYPKSNINKALRLKEIDANGFMWGLEKLNEYNCPKNASVKIGQYKDDVLIKS